MQFMITAYDGTDENALARRMEVRPRHLESIKKVKEIGSVKCAGGITNNQGAPIGSFLIMEFEDRQALDNYLAAEPYILENVWQDIKIETCNVVIMNDEF